MMPNLHLDDTIAAIATPVGEGGLSVIRISGPESIDVAGRIFKDPSGKKACDYTSHTVHFGHVVDKQGRAIDQVLLTLFRHPKSYTGEDVVEISSHGGLTVTRRILELTLQNGARMAEPGEFTKRAFLNHKMDLSQAEAVLDLIKAKSDRSLQVAVRQLEGALSRRFRLLRDNLMEMYAHMEAFVDFPEEDIEIFSDRNLHRRFQSAQEEMSRLRESFKRGSLLREGISCVIAGRPNVGKSSLFNALLDRDRALVSEYEGTTRDMLEECIEIEGVFIRLVDTAGLGRDFSNPLDRLGTERTRQVLKEAGIILYMVDGGESLTGEDKKIYSELPPEAPVLVLVNKCDREKRLNEAELKGMIGERPLFHISTKTREGLDLLEKRMGESVLEGNLDPESEQITRLRHKNTLESALESLKRAREAFDRRESLDLVTIDLRAALDQMRELIGEIYSEDLLDMIFSEFCIGK